MDRSTYQTRTIRIVGDAQRKVAEAALRNLPIDPDKPIEVVIREEKKTRKLDQNARYWAGPLRDISEQAWLHGQRFDADTWHYHCRKEYLPEDDDPELEILVKDGYRKWSITPAGERVLIGSTTMLTVKGFARYMEQVYALGGDLGVMFREVVR